MNPIIKFFDYDHLKMPQKDISMSCYILAMDMSNKLGESAETTAGLRKLLEAKDCFVRASLTQGD